jgi:hypothetical protein
MIEIINKKHKGIDFNHRQSQSVFVSINKKEIYFSAGACRKFNLKPDNYLHFVNDGEKIYFYQNKDKDGFKLIRRPTKNSFLIMDVSLVKYFIKQKQFSLPCSFELSWSCCGC